MKCRVSRRRDRLEWIGAPGACLFGMLGWVAKNQYREARHCTKEWINQPNIIRVRGKD